jgi:predicted DNA-binding transcriptional regulator YafY
MIKEKTWLNQKPILQAAKMLMHDRYTLKQLANHFDTSERSIYRWMNTINEIGWPVERDFNGKFFIVEGCCPMCGSSTNI